MASGESISPLVHADSHFLGQIRPQIAGNGFSFLINSNASLYLPWEASFIYPCTAIWAGQAVLHGLVPLSTTSSLLVLYSGFHLSSPHSVLRGFAFISIFSTTSLLEHSFCPSFKALVGQFTTHSPQATHLSLSTFDT